MMFRPVNMGILIVQIRHGNPSLDSAVIGPLWNIKHYKWYIESFVHTQTGQIQFSLDLTGFTPVITDRYLQDTWTCG